MSDISISMQEIDDLAEEIKTLKSEVRKDILETYARATWLTGQVICTHPAFIYGKKMNLYKILSEKTGFSQRYLQNCVRVYQALPFQTVEEAFAALREKLPDQFIITQKALLSAVSDKNSQTIANDTPPFTSFKNAVPIFKNNIAGVLENAIYIRVYYSDHTNKLFSLEDEIDI